MGDTVLAAAKIAPNSAAYPKGSVAAYPVMKISGAQGDIAIITAYYLTVENRIYVFSYFCNGLFHIPLLYIPKPVPDSFMLWSHIIYFKFHILNCQQYY